MIVVFIVVLVVFGPQKLPELAKGLGKLMAEFRKASLDFRNAFEEEMRDLERQALQTERKKAAEATAASATGASSQQPAALPTAVEAEKASAETKPEAAAAEAPVVAAVAEAVARSSEELPEMKTEQPTGDGGGGQESHQETQHPA